jgi:hypothetical protein
VDLFDVARSCFRRWYVIAPLLLITAWYCYNAYTSVKPVYYSSALLGLSVPSTRLDQTEPGVPVPRNGLLDIGGASLIANIAAVGLHDTSVVQHVVAAGGLPGYTSRMYPVPLSMPQLPMIMVEVTDANPAAVTKTLELVLAEADPTLRTLQEQARVPADQMVTSFVITPPNPPAPGMPTRTRSTISIFLAGAGLSVLLTVIIDVLLIRRKSRPRKGQYREAELAPDRDATPQKQDIDDKPQDIHPQSGPAEAADDVIRTR